MYLEYVNRAEGNREVTLEFGNELVAEYGDDEAEQKVEEQAKAARNTVGLVHVVGGFQLSELDETLCLDFRNIVDGSHGREGGKNEQCRNGVAVHLADEQRDDFYDNDQKESAHNRGRFGFAVLVEVAGRIEALKLADVDRHKAHDENDGKHGGDTCAEQTTVEKINAGKMIKPLAKHIKFGARIC